MILVVRLFLNPHSETTHLQCCSLNNISYLEYDISGIIITVKRNIRLDDEFIVPCCIDCFPATLFQDVHTDRA